jgi:hypothetical protein
MRIGKPNSKLLYLALSVSVVTLASACADLVVKDVRHEAWLGSQRLVKAIVKNEGWRDAPPSTTRLDVKPATASTFTRNSTMQTPALARGQEIELPMSPLQSSEIPAAGSGQCLELKVCADAGSTVGEGWFSEGNNCRTRSDCR